MYLAKVITILIIDTGIMPIHGLETYVTNAAFEQVEHPHGTAVAYIALGKAEKIKLCGNIIVHSCNYRKLGYMGCLQHAAKYNYDFVNISLEGSDKYDGEEDLLRIITNKGTIVTVASGNDYIKNLKIKKSYPASYLYEGLINFRVVGDPESPIQNRGPGVYKERGTYFVPTMDGSLAEGTGSSYAAPTLLRKYLTSYCYESNSSNDEMGGTCHM